MAKSKVLIVGGTGYLGKRLVKASLGLGHETNVLHRPEIGVDIEKVQMLLSFKKQGARLVPGSFHDHRSLVDAVKLVDVVICAISGVHIRSHRILHQLKLVGAIKEARNVKGDGEGGIEMTGSMQLIREFCDQLVDPEKIIKTRIFFPEANEGKFARKSAFEGASFKLDYLTKPSFLEDFGFIAKVKMVDRVRPEDELFLVAYPYFNVNDYPPFFYPKLAALTKTLFPNMETVYYIHNFKGLKGGTLFRCYPGPWKVLRRLGNRYMTLHEREAMPSLKEVALNILPSG